MRDACACAVHTLEDKRLSVLCQYHIQGGTLRFGRDFNPPFLASTSVRL